MKEPNAYARKIAHDMFIMTIEWLEKYIEVAYGDYFPDWQSRKQIHDDNIKRTDIDGNPEMAEDTLATQLFLTSTNINRKLSFISDELKEEFYKWINATRIKTDNCPKRLKCFLLGIHKTLEGDNKITKDIKNSQRDCEPGSPEYAEQMSNLSNNVGENLPQIQKEEQNLEGKKWNEITIESKFPKGNAKLGKEAFEEIAKSITDYDKFYFCPQKGEPEKPKKPTDITPPLKHPLRHPSHKIMENPKEWAEQRKLF